jgi:catechol 2,3-dioxygenase
MEEQTVTQIKKPFRLPQGTHIGFVHLQVSDLRTALHFYRDLLGFRESAQDGNTAYLSATGHAPYHVILSQPVNPVLAPRRSTGLFHLAVRVPNRTELGKVVKHLLQERWPIEGTADHLVSEAVYLTDPDGNGVELYADRPREKWPVKGGEIEMATESLEVEELLRAAEMDGRWNGIHPETVIGHVHLKVSDLKRGEAFYHDLLGFDVTQRSYPGALFLAASGYHHHVGINVWTSRGAGPAPENAIGLLSFEICVPDKPTLRFLRARLEEELVPVKDVLSDVNESFMVRDPNGIQIELAVG